MQGSHRRPWIIPLWLIVATLAALLVRAPFLDWLSHDIIGHLGQWYDYIVLNGGFYALADRFADYTPAYLYLLSLSAALRGWVWPALSKVAAIKLPSVAADLAMAVAVYKLVQIQSPQRWKPALAFTVVLLLPTVVINSAVWGQADSMYAACIIACVYLLCARRPAAAMIAFGIGLALKAQMVFIAPLLLFLLLRRGLRLRHLFIAPLVYALIMLPAMLLGRPPLDALGSYVVQANEYRQLSLGAPNFYLFVPADLYHLGTQAGIVIGFIAGLTIALAFTLRQPEPQPADILACALVCVLVMPFVLPKMHERYFFVADVLSVAAALRWRRLGWLPVAYQFISLSAYATVLPALSGWNQVLPGVNSFVWINAVVVSSVSLGLVLTRGAPDPRPQRHASLVLSAGGLGMLMVVGVAGLLAPTNRRPPVWVSNVANFHPANAVSITFGDAVELLGYALPQPRTYRTGIMPIDLYFTPLRALQQDDRLRVEAFALDGRSLELINESVVSEAPLSTWAVGQVYLQRRFLTVWPTVDAPLLATFKISWVDAHTSQPLPVRCAAVACDGKLTNVSIPIGLDSGAVAPWLRAAPLATLGAGHELALLEMAHSRASPGQTMTLTTTWRMQARAMGDLTFFVHVLGPDGTLVAQADSPPRGGLYPTRVWHIGEVVVDALHVALPAALARGQYRVIIGAYPPDTQQRLPAFDARSNPLPANVVEGAPLNIGAP